MAISLSSVGFNSTFSAIYQHVSRSPVRASSPKATRLISSSGIISSIFHIKRSGRSMCISVADSDNLATDTSDKGPDSTESSISYDQLSSVDSPGGTSQLQTRVDNESGPQTSGVSNGSTVSSDVKQERGPNSQSTAKRSPLTARERLRAARVLSRYTETKASKSEMGSKILDALKESDKGKKRSGLPEAPTNLFDDSDRGMPKEGWTFEFPGGSDLFVIAFSFVFISTVMFATTYIVWKVGAIHFNEY
ncbi:uncharacterized protein LOC110619844 isoform X2 [Manihot esculenta]|uniref:Uncharacterized protein n=1 Tax=Manihot esculenta TaxID=3983 RepID=A0A2C9VL05_MANES|nr:uncharacterized protein LOC110619844 isoform X2 [Manihot esculenta]OAY46282.1 hypothetical protein MANES_07G131600v8 [Manihot esculenta]